MVSSFQYDVIGDARFNLKRFYGKFGSFKLDCALFISK